MHAPEASTATAEPIAPVEPAEQVEAAETGEQVEAPPSGLARFEPLICRVLCVNPGGSTLTGRSRRADDAATHRVFNVSIALSAIRCLLSYVVFPIIVPAIGGAAAVPPAAGIPIAVVALVFDVIAVRRFWASTHPWRWPVTLVYAVVMGLVLALLVNDVVHLFS